MKHWQRKKNETKGILDKTGLAFIPSALVCVDWWLKLVMTWGSVSVVSEAEVGVIFVVVFIVFTVVFSVTINLNFFFFFGSTKQVHFTTTYKTRCPRSPKATISNLEET